MSRELFNKLHLEWYQKSGLIQALAERKRLGSKLLPTGLVIELGALAWPTPLSDRHSVLYTDFRTPSESNHHYGGKLPGKDHSAGLVPIGLDWEILSGPVAQAYAGQIDGFIANHVFEHLPKPIWFLQKVAAFLKPGGRLMLTVPDASKIYDKPRHRTNCTDLVISSIDSSIHRCKILEYVIQVEHLKKPADIWERANAILDKKEDPHLWTFDRYTYPIVLQEIIEWFNLPFEIKETHYNEPFEEIIAFIERTS